MEQPAATDNRANQRNPNNAAYWKVRGFTKRPVDWRQRVRSGNDLKAASSTGASQAARAERR